MTDGQKRQSAYFRRSAQRIADEAAESFQKKAYDRVVRKTQEAVELHLKALLLEEGIEPVKTHNLVQLASGLKKKVPLSNKELAFLTEERIPSFYGAADFVPDEAYEVEDGTRCLNILKTLGLLK